MYWKIHPRGPRDFPRAGILHPEAKCPKMPLLFKLAANTFGNRHYWKQIYISLILSNFRAGSHQEDPGLPHG